VSLDGGVGEDTEDHRVREKNGTKQEKKGHTRLKAVRLRTRLRGRKEFEGIIPRRYKEKRDILREDAREILTLDFGKTRIACPRFP